MERPDPGTGARARTGATKIRLLILDRDLVTCRALAHAFNAYEDIEVIGYATSSEEIDAGETDRSSVLVVLASHAVPDVSVVKLAARLMDEGSEIRLIVTGLDGSEWTILRYIEAGVDGYVLEDADVPSLAETIRAAATGEARLSPRIAYLVMRRLAALHARCEASGLDVSLLTKLTERERETLDLIGRRLSNREIADELGVSLGTVKSHVHNVLKKLQVPRREEAAAYLLLAGEEPEGISGTVPRARPE